MAGKIAFALCVLPVALAVTYDVTVGAGGELAYVPPYVNAAPGDVVNFIFHPKNHTVTQSSFEAPCVGLEEGERSGFRPVTDANGPLPELPIPRCRHYPQVVLLWSDRPLRARNGLCDKPCA
ncbi:hypothetical protein BDN71DRAFT_1458163 [Pleurotus eryngii]|uniref:Uncharacterized protein n=1 Tax=Pleurotus eryngii TaxID=5323 RepID=A0A9P5ZGE5_PLEER|nr:hypothetical protein BDN71DRAFT_1458163 [Pleurotus eryngii]